MKAQIIRLALVGPPAAGKTSFLAALHGVGCGTVERDQSADWIANAHPDSLVYLRTAWDEIRTGQPVTHTSIDSDHAPLHLTVTRRAGPRGSATHVFHLEVLDSAGEFTREMQARTHPRWKDVAMRIQEADVLLLLLDAMNVFHTQLRGGGESQDQILDFREMAIAAVGGQELLKEKLLAVCLSKCDAVTNPRIDGVNDEADATLLANSLLGGEYQHLLAQTFAEVGYFGVSILGNDWRWSRTGPCLKVSGSAISPVGLFNPFEWIHEHIQRRRS